MKRMTSSAAWPPGQPPGKDWPYDHTRDRDLLQLVNNRIVVALPNKSGSNDDYFAEDVEAKLGVFTRTSRGLQSPARRHFG